LHMIPLMNAPPNKVDNYCHNYMVQLRPIIWNMRQLLQCLQ